MEQTYRNPGWLTGLLIVFAVATAITFGLFLWKHAEEASLFDRYVGLKAERQALTKQKNDLDALVPGLTHGIQIRDAKIAEVISDVATTREDVGRLLSDADVAQKAAGEAMQREAKTYATLLDDAKRLRLELGQQEATALTAERDFDERRTKARDQIEKTATEVEGIRREARRQNGELQGRVDELSSRVQQLTQQRDFNNRDLKSDGEVLAARATDGYVVIDRGHQHHLRKGTRFVVFNRRAGKNVVKGTVEVVEVDARTSTARVEQEMDGNDPLIPGDMLHNPVYDPDAVRTFVIAGDFTRFSKAELARFITDTGGKVASDLSTVTDYLVAGDRAQRALDQASKLGVSILSEDQLLDFVRYRPEFAVRSGMVVVLVGKFTVVSKSKVEDFVKQSGGTIGSRVDTGVQVLIAGKGADSDIARARSLGITILDQSQFAHLANAKRE